MVAARILRGVAPVVGLAIATVVLGAWGLSLVPGEDLGATETAYRTLLLFNLGSSVSDSAVPWQLDVARFLGPLTVFYALVGAVFAVARERVQRLRTRLFARAHVLIVGIGTRGAQTARSLRDSHRVVGIELDAANGSARSLRATGIPVLIGDARDRSTLRAARAARAAHIAILAGSDSVNLGVLAALRLVLEGKPPVPVHVSIDAPALWAKLHRLPLESAKSPRRIEFVSVPDRVAQLLVESASGEDHVSGDGQRIVIHGAGPAVARVAVHLLRSELVGDDAEVTLEGPGALESMKILGAIDGWAFERARVSVGDRDDARLQATRAFVCGLPQADALGAAVMLVDRIEDGASVHVAVPDDDVKFALDGAGIDLERVKLVATSEAALGERLLTGAAFEQIARGRHAMHVTQQLAAGDSARTNRALLPWEKLDPVYRQANYQYADGLVDVLARLDAELVPLTGRAVGDLPIPDDLVEELAIAEHDRWWRDKEHDGWRYTDGDKDEIRKLHPLMKPWAELDESDREKDRIGLRELPKLFAAVGYELIVPDALSEGRRAAPTRPAAG